MITPSPSEIAKRAYHIWEREGRPHGRDQEHWYAAEREILGATTAEEDRPIGEIRRAQQASARQTGAAAPGKPSKPTAPGMARAAAATTEHAPQVQGSQTAGTPAQSPAGQWPGPQAQQSSSSKAKSPRGAKSQTTEKRKPRTGGKQPNP
jgi:hypothetical protein